MKNPKLNIVAIDDHHNTLRGVELLISKLLPSSSITTFSEGVKALYSIKENMYDLYIIDLELQDIGGMILINEIRDNNCEAKIIVHTMHEGVWDIMNLKKMAINGIVLKVSDELGQAIKSVVAGNTYYCKRFKYLNKIGNDINPDTNLLKEKISQTELDIINYISKGLSDREISDMMPQTLNTIRKYRQRLYSKFDVHSSEELMVKTMSNGFSFHPKTKHKKGY